MNKHAKILAVIVCAAILFTVPAGTLAAASGLYNKPSKAQEVQILSKVTLKAPAQRPEKPVKTPAASSTGIIGDPQGITGQKYAIVIGINDYYGTSSDLQYAVNDADTIVQTLSATYGFTNIKLFTDSGATYSSIKNYVLSLQSVLNDADQDELFFFFSGHGAKGKVDDGDKNLDQSIVVWNDAKNGFDYIWDGELKQWFAPITDRIVFAFDSCLSGGMSVLKSSNRVVAMASTATGYSYESSDYNDHGQFTYYFAEKGMLQGLADGTDVDQLVTVEEAFDYAKLSCISQTPTIADLFSNDLYLSNVPVS